jgi:hypothetical protein
MRIKVPVVPASFVGMVLGLAGLGTAAEFLAEPKQWGTMVRTNR